jgi:LacI family transcriptional regulator
VPFARFIEPPLTTVHQPTEEIGRWAAVTLIGMIERGHSGPDPEAAGEPERRMPVELVVRGSTGPPRAAER